MIMALLQDPDDATNLARVPKADEYPGHDGWIVLAEEEWPTLAMLQEERWNRVKAIRAERKAGGVTIPGIGTVQTDDESTSNITGLVVMAQVAISQGAAFAEPFTLADNSVHDFNAAGMIGMGVAVGQHVAAVYARARELRAAILAAPDAAALELIDVEGGWPGAS